MERELLLLGMLRTQDMHGYHLYEMLDAHLGTSVHLKKPTVYKLLNKMVSDGWVTEREEREGNYPPRRVFAITAGGEKAFQKILRQNLAGYKAIDFPNNIGLAFLDQISPDEALPLLQERRAIVEDLLESARSYESGHEDLEGHYGLMLAYQVRYYAAELEWIDSVLTHLNAEG